MNSILQQILRGIGITVALVIIVIVVFLIGFSRTPEMEFHNDPQFLQKAIKSLGDGRFVFGFTNHNISLCDTQKKNSKDFDGRNCLGDYVKSIQIEPPFIYVYFAHPLQDKINPEFFNVKKGEESSMSFFLFGPEDEYKISSYEKIPNYIKINYNSGERWIYGISDLERIAKSDRLIFDQITKNQKLILDGREYINRIYEGAENNNSIGTYFGSNNSNSRSQEPFLKQ